jgi:hypothetical protein
MGRTGQLTTLSVEKPDAKRTSCPSMIFPMENATKISALAYGLCILLFVTVIILMVLSQDWWGIFVVLVLAFSRFLNVIIIQRRNKPGWFGADEGETRGDLIILLSQDRWVRMQGLVNDLKAVTSGQWLRDLTRLESTVVGFATLLVHLDAALASNLKQFGKIMLIVLLVGTAGLLDIANAATDELLMHARVIKLKGKRKSYGRRIDLARELVQESGRSDWAIKTGMLNEDNLKESDENSPRHDEGQRDSEAGTSAKVDSAVSPKGIVTRTIGGSSNSKTSMNAGKVSM